MLELFKKKREEYEKRKLKKEIEKLDEIHYLLLKQNEKIVNDYYKK